MTKKELKRLGRKRQLELLAEQTGKANRLRRENERLRERIADREQYMAQMGELTESILRRSSHLDAEKEALTFAYLEQLRTAIEEDGEETEEEEASETTDWPAREQLLLEAKREGGMRRYLWSLKTTVYALITVAAVVVLIAVLVLPVLQIYGTSMNPTLNDGDFVVSIKGSKMSTGDLLAFYYNNKILVKRVIASPGQWVRMDADGTVYVDDVKINESYLVDKAFGECDIEMPYQVPENRVFVMGDNRSVSVDSRSTSAGCIPEEQVVGKIVFRVWPLSAFGLL